MSGGSYEYAFEHLKDLEGEIRTRTEDPLRLAFADLLGKCAEAARAIEWVDSWDRAPGSEYEEISRALNFNPEMAVVRQVYKIVARATEALGEAITENE